MSRYDTNKLKAFCVQAMASAGLPEEESRRFAESLIGADMRGIRSHGVTRLKTYYLRLRDGLVDAKAMPEVVADLPALMIVDGRNAMGVTAASHTMEECIHRARQTGCCFASVRGGNHFGYAAYFTEMAAREGMIGVAMCNAASAVAPYGGKTAQLGTNPLAVSIPGKDTIALDLDMATSIVARGKVKLAAKEGWTIPAEWAVDADGRPTTDPNNVECMLPIGGYKGYGIGLVIEILSSCLSGADTSQNLGGFYDFSGTHQNVGFFLGAMNIGGVADMTGFHERVDALIRAIKESPKAVDCDEILVAGEIEARKAKAAAAEGIDIPPAVLRELEEVSAFSGVPFQCEL